MPKPYLNSSFSLGDAMQQIRRPQKAWRTPPCHVTPAVSLALLPAELDSSCLLLYIANIGCTGRSLTAVHDLIAHYRLL